VATTKRKPTAKRAMTAVRAEDAEVTAVVAAPAPKRKRAPKVKTPDAKTPPHATGGAIDLLSDPVKRWVETTFGALTPPQEAAIPAVHAGRHVLVSAPTGTGKTLAAFLAVLSELVADFERGTLGDTIQCVYISPLRALGYDVQRNLERPLAELCADYMEACGVDPETGEPWPSPIRVANRTGDTTPAERKRIANKPPHVLVTTPESLAIMLATPSFRPHFRGVRWVVVDEVHAVAGGKRGVHLALSLERLAHAADRDPVRVGLSATVSPLGTVAEWLTGPDRPTEVIAWSASRESTFAVQSVLTGEVIPNPQAVQREVAKAVADRVRKHRTTLVFTNTRGATERLAHRLMATFGEEHVAAHHSSLAREERVRVEESLREGKFRAVVTSTSLELGIDIGTVDETVLVSSPRDVTRALQRIGRSGHRIDRHPAGLFIATGVDDLLECAVVADRCRAGLLDPVRPPHAPLDVLAQQLVGMSTEGEWRDDDAYALVRRSGPYASLSRADFDAVLDYLSETSEELEERRVYAKIERDQGVFRARGRSVQTIFFQNVGTISGGASIRIKPRGQSEPIGTVEEDFLEQLKPGDRFLLAGRVWSFMYAQGMTAFVAPATGRPSVPRWASEILPATAGVARGVGELRATLRDVLHASGEAGLAADVADRFGIVERDAIAVARYVAANDRLSPIPDADQILVERWPDPDDERVMVHAVTAPLGRRANDALARAVALRAARSTGLLVDDQAFALRVPKRSMWTLEMLPELFSPDGFADDVRRAIARSDLWGRRFRQVASIGLMLVKNYHGRSRFVGAMQMNARKIWHVLERERPDFPLVRETYRTVLEDDLDVDGAHAWLAECRGRITLRDVAAPPPFVFRLLAAGTTDSMLLEERDAFLKRLWEQAQALADAGA
jgi:ATP-dependent helicase Lhr and Lhr-like helicase